MILEYRCFTKQIGCFRVVAIARFIMKSLELNSRCAPVSLSSTTQPKHSVQHLKLKNQIQNQFPIFDREIKQDLNN